MAIKGAFGAGFVQGFGESMKKNAEKRFDQQQRYVDNMMENARRLAPKYMQDKATADSAVELMNEFQTRYGVTNEEFIALYQTHDVGEVYKMIQAEEAGLRPNEQLDVRKNILGALNIPKGTKLPAGMRAEDAVRSMVLGYAQNLGSKPGDVSEAHKNNSWAKAVSNVLALNPRASAEEQIAGMQVAGVPVQQILQYQAMQGGKYKPLEGVTRSGVINFDDGYSDGDYDTTYSSYASAFRLTFANTDDISALNGLPLDEAMKKAGVSTKEELVERIKAGGVAMAELELSLANVGVGKTTRDSAMRRIAAEVNTGQQFDNMKAAVNSGLAVDLIRESMAKYGSLTDEYIDKILQNQPVKKKAAAAPISTAPVVTEPSAAAVQTAEVLGQEPSLAERQAGRFDRDVLPQQPIDPSLTNAGIVSGLVGGDVVSDTAPSVSTTEDSSVTMQNLSKLYNPAEDKEMSVEDRINAKREATKQIAGDVADTLEGVGDKLAAIDKTLDAISGNATLNVAAKALTTLGSLAQVAGKEDLSKTLYSKAIEAEDGSIGGVRFNEGLYEATNEILDNLNLFMPDEIAPDTDAVNAFIDYPNTAGRNLDADLGIGYEPATTRLYSTMDRLKKLSLAVSQDEITPEAIVEAVSKPAEERDVNRAAAMLYGKAQDTEMGGGTFSSDATSANLIQPEKRQPELISYEEWKGMSKADRKKIGLDLSLYAIQNRTRGGRIAIPEGYSLPDRLRMDQPENMATSEAEASPRVPADEAIMTKPSRQDLSTPSSSEEGISVERSTDASKSLSGLRTMFKRIHGKNSKAADQLERVLQEAQSGTPIQYTDVNQLLRITRSLPKTKTRDELAKKLYDLAQGLR